MVTTSWPPGSTDAESKSRLALGVDCPVAGRMPITATMPAVTATIIAANTILSEKFFLFCHAMLWEGAPIPESAEEVAVDDLYHLLLADSVVAFTEQVVVDGVDHFVLVDRAVVRQ